MPVSIGDKLGPFEILAHIGKGGMGEVWKAHDPRLNRDVAIKVSAAQFSDRFQREAHAIAALNHPNICTLHDIGSDYLVMEFVDGKPLKGPLPLDKILSYTSQICDAIDAAHRKGIVHRDLKPSNILVTRQGIKVLDFGIAKTAGLETLTEMGALIGTPAYMSPEQREGKEADTRSDIYSLGCVIYEMATGNHIPNRTLDPPALDRAVKGCIATDPEERWQTAREVKLALAMVQQPAPILAARSTNRWKVVAAGLALMMLLLVAWSVWRTRSGESRLVHLQLSPPSGTRFTEFGQAVSPDGNRLAFVASAASGRQSLWIRSLYSPEAREVEGTDGASYPFWSPDNGSVAFFASAKLKRVDLAGGTVQVICDAPAGRGGTWSPTGTIVFAPSFNEGLYRVPAAGARPQSLLVLDAGRQEYSQRSPSFLPDGNAFLYWSLTSSIENSGVYVSTLDEPMRVQKIISSSHYAQYAPNPAGGPGHLLWVSGETLMAQPFDLSARRLEGKGTPIAHLPVPGSMGGMRFSVSGEGVLVYAGTAPISRRLQWRDRSGRVLGVEGESEAYYTVRLSRNGQRIALNSTDSSGNVDIWIREVSRGVRARLTSGQGFDGMPVWSPDGRKVAFSGARSGPLNLFWTDASGTGHEELLTNSKYAHLVYDWSSYRGLLAYTEFHPTTAADVWVLALDATQRKAEPFIVTQFNETFPQFSPDARWLAYTSNESGREEIHVIRFPSSPGQRRWVISSQGGAYPRWNANGSELFYVSSDSKLISVQANIDRAEPVFSTPRELFQIPVRLGVIWYDYDVAPDGQRFLVLAPADDAAPQPLTVVINWQAGSK